MGGVGGGLSNRPDKSIVSLRLVVANRSVSRRWVAGVLRRIIRL